MNKLAIIAITSNGFALGEKIFREYEGIDLLTIKKRDGWESKWENLGSLVNENFSKYDGLIFIMATGIVVRMIDGCLVNKATDPAIIVLDELGKNTISLLSGHLGGGNDLAKEIAAFLDNRPVITTATDVNDYYAIDSFAKDYGLKIEPISNIKIFNKAILNGDKISIYYDEGIKLDNIIENSPDEFVFLPLSNNDFPENEKGLTGIITHRTGNSNENLIYLRPSNLILGVGCKKDFSPELFENNILNELKHLNISISSIRQIQSIDIKLNEIAIVSFAEKYKIPFSTYSSEYLNKVFQENSDLKRSEFVFNTTGTYGVAEPSALISNDYNNKNLELLCSRREIGGMTLALSIERPYILHKKNNYWLKRRDSK